MPYFRISGFVYKIFQKCLIPKKSSLSDECAKKAKGKSIGTTICVLDLHKKDAPHIIGFLAFSLKVVHEKHKPI